MKYILSKRPIPIWFENIADACTSSFKLNTHLYTNTHLCGFERAQHIAKSIWKSMEAHSSNADRCKTCYDYYTLYHICYKHVQHSHRESKYIVYMYSILYLHQRVYNYIDVHMQFYSEIEWPIVLVCSLRAALQQWQCVCQRRHCRRRHRRRCYCCINNMPH